MQAPDNVISASDTSDPRRGLQALASLRTYLGTLELRQVEEGLRQGMSWTEIADALGVTRQAVHQKYSRRVDPSINVPRRSKR